MSPTMKRMLSGASPAWLKVLATQFGARRVIGAAALLVGFVALVLLTALRAPARAGWPAALAALGVEGWLGWRLRAFRLGGQVLCAFGCVAENLSQVHRARRRFLAALKPLANRQRVYEGLYRIAETEGELREVAETIRANEQAVSVEPAILSGRCLHEAGDPDAALPYFELAHRLRPSDEVGLDLAELYLGFGFADKCLQTVERLAQPDGNGRSFFLRAAALRMLGRPKEALPWANRATQHRPCQPDFQLEKGKILEALGKSRAAYRQYDKAIRVHFRNPEAYFRRALLGLRAGQQESAIKDLERCYYYENTHTDAYLLAQRAKNGEYDPLDKLRRRNSPAWMRVEASPVELVKGDSASVVVTLCPDSVVEACRVAALEPFGAGLEVQPQEAFIGLIDAGELRPVEFRVKAKRPHTVNLGCAWTVNFVFTSDRAWASRSVHYRVRDNEPGRVFLVLTNDHEPRPRAGQRRAADKYAVETHAFVRDLVRAGKVANQLGKRFGFRWTHMLDAGGGIALPRWAGARNQKWDDVRHQTESHYRAAAEEGHDFQLHLHLSAVPESAFFCYEFDPDEQMLFFDLRRRNRLAEGKKVNSWSNVTPRYGKSGSVGSRTGSLAHAKRLVTSVFATHFPACQPILFRAGQWDLGASLADKEKSVLALRENGLLADSSVTNGDHYGDAGPDFGRPSNRTCYFTHRNDPSARARKLRDAGLVEVVPIVQPQGRHPVTPRDDPKPVVHAYRSFTENGRVKPGRHLIMEIEHLATVSAPREAEIDSDATAGGDWLLMEKHFARVRQASPALEAVGASEAIWAWLDYYSPELVVRPGRCAVAKKEEESGSRSIRFPLQFLGEGILTCDERLYQLHIPLPAPSPKEVRRFRVFEGNAVVLEGQCDHSGRVSLSLRLSRMNQDSFAMEIRSNGVGSRPVEKAATSVAAR